MTGETAKGLAAAVAAAVVTATLTYLVPTRAAINEVEDHSKERHVVSCTNAEANRALIRQAAEGLLDPVPMPPDASPTLREFIELSNAERERARADLETNTRTPVECLR